MRLVMFHPVDHPLKRGWVGRIEGEHVIQLAAQTLQAFFTGGGTAREHAVFPRTGVQLLAPVLHPPSVRVFDDQRTFGFANPAAIVGPGASVGKSPSDTEPQGGLGLLPRVAGMIGSDEEVAGFTVLAEWRATGVRPPKDRDFALGLGPLVVTADELAANVLELLVRVDGDERLRARFDGFDWEAARALAADGTTLRAGDLLAGPSPGIVRDLVPGSSVDVEVDGIGVLSQIVAS
ncbi:MAG: fumarylacetoacetate hydrolase family protein [Actinobacteria bacterium]|nr:fumarylacetoacetate hydrolase family protein [Actinomycetota bacterium]